jgi:DNA-binding MarR family transcriptional regulator
VDSESGRMTPSRNPSAAAGLVDPPHSPVQSAEWPDRQDFHSYVEAIAHARFVIRRAMRIADEEARKRGVEPLQHQVLLQVYGTSEPLSIRAIADRMDIVPAFASRLVKSLEDMGYISRHAAEHDKRVSHVEATEQGVALLREIDAEVRVHVAYFQRQLSPEARLAALVTFGFYVGLSSDSTVARAIESARAELSQVRGS